MSRGVVRRLLRQHAGIDVSHGKALRLVLRRPVQPSSDLPARVWSAHEQKRLRKTFAALAEARAWRAEAQTAIRRRAPKARAS